MRFKGEAKAVLMDGDWDEGRRKRCSRMVIEMSRDGFNCLEGIAVPNAAGEMRC